LPTRSLMARARREIDTFTIPEGRRRRVYRPCAKRGARLGGLSTKTMLADRLGLAGVIGDYGMPTVRSTKDSGAGIAA
jgi:hypothetical protein